MNETFVFNGTSFFGWGCRSELANQISSYKFKRALVVTDDNLIKLGLTEKVLNVLNNTNMEYDVFSDVKPNPTITNVKRGLKIAKKNHNDCIIAIGGGSVIDTAKAIGIIINNPEFKDIISLEGFVRTKNNSLPLFALPTTFGTGSEVTTNYDITDEERKLKLICIDPHCVPIVSIVDSELMSYMPSSLAASTGLDALTHAMECYITKNHNEMSDMFALKAMNIIFNNIEKAVINDREAIEKMALAQYIAGMGLSNAGLGIVHSMSHQLGAMYDAQHGIANAILLPYVLKYNSDACSERFIAMGKAIGLNMDEVKEEDAVEMVIESVMALNSRLNVPQHIKEVGTKYEDISLMAFKALNDPCTAGNPKDMNVKDFEELFKKAF